MPGGDSCERETSWGVRGAGAGRGGGRSRAPKLSSTSSALLTVGTGVKAAQHSTALCWWQQLRGAWCLQADRDQGDTAAQLLQESHQIHVHALFLLFLLGLQNLALRSSALLGTMLISR